MSLPVPDDTLDLHGYTVAEAIELFVQRYNDRVKHGQTGCWQVIHGYGSTGAGGAIRQHLRQFLTQYADKLRWEDGDRYGDPGWTWVYPNGLLPNRQDRLAQVILQFCAEPKSGEKILREFAREGELPAKQALRSLVAQGRLRVTGTGTKVKYQAHG